MKHEKFQPWYKHAVLYHIYPLSFADANGDGYGDLRGIINHLDYLNDGTAESLGVGAVWLSPIYASPMADFGYDVKDYMAVDPRFGSMADFEELIAALHGRGMKLLMDYVPNHTSSEHPWFIDSQSSHESARRDWYIWADPSADGGPPNNWLSHFGGSAWTFSKATGQYYLHSFLPQQPDLNWRNPQVRRAMLGVLHFWLQKGVDGFRTDAVYGLIKDAKLRDDIPDPAYREGISVPTHRLLRVHSAGQSELNEVIGSFCDVLAERADTYLLSEAYLNLPELHHLYEACKAHPIHAPFNFNLMSLEWSATAFRSFIDEYEASMGQDDWPNYVLGNHDRSRLASRLGEDRSRMLALLQLTLRGLPVIYYGDELGMVNGVITPAQERDPRGKLLPGFDLGRDKARTPMAWSPEAGGGFGPVEGWLPLSPGWHSRNVSAEDRNPESTLNLYRHLIHLRKTCPALIEGDYHSLDVPNTSIYAFVRETELQRIIVLLNFGKTAHEVKIGGKLGAWIAGTHLVEGDGVAPAGNTIELGPYEGRVYEVRAGTEL